MSEYARGAEAMRQACIKVLSRVAENKAFKELEARQTSQHDREHEWFLGRIAVVQSIDDISAIALEDEGVSQTQEPISGARTTAPGSEAREIIEDALKERLVTADGSPGLHARMTVFLAKSSVRGFPDNLPLADPIPRADVVNALMLHLAQIDFEKNNWDWDSMARDAYLFLMQPGMPCGHARAFFFQNEQGLTGCVACDMWEDAFAK